MNHQRGYGTRRLRAGLLVHSNCGGQYCANAYRALPDQHHCLRSPSRRDECRANAQAESLWSCLKTEGLEAHEWPVFREILP